jgi:hypothetical protein
VLGTIGCYPPRPRARSLFGENRMRRTLGAVRPRNRRSKQAEASESHGVQNDASKTILDVAGSVPNRRYADLSETADCSI